MPYRMQTGSWQPARLRWIDHAVLIIGLIVIAYLRGLDYLIGDDVWGARDFMNAAAPEWVWGFVGFLMGALILSAGVATQRHLLVYIGHGWLATAYGLNALALAIASGPTLAFPIVVLVCATVAGVCAMAHRLVMQTRRHLAYALIVSAATLVGFGMYFSETHFDGVRGGGEVGLVAVLHLIHMIRTGGRPLRIEDASHASEQVVDGGSGGRMS